MDNPAIWRHVISESRTELLERLDPMQCALYLYRRKVIGQYEYEKIDKKGTTDSQRICLLDVLVTKDTFWNPLLKYLHQASQSSLAEELEETYKRLEQRGAPAKGQNPPFVRSLLRYAPEELMTRLKREYECIENTWGDLLPTTNLSMLYVDLEIQPIGSSTETTEDYSFIWENSGTRIVIEGDPGTGKTIYLSRIAMEWANKHAELRQHFDVVIFVPLGRVEVDSLVETVKAMVESRQSKEEVESIFDEFHNDRLLLLLDGYDEFNSQRFKEIENIVQMEKYHNVKTVIATRPSRTIDIKKKHLKLLLKGFSKEKAELFLKKHCIDKGVIERLLQDSNISDHDAQNPLFLTGLIVILKHQDNSWSKGLDSAGRYDMLERLLKHLWTHKYREQGRLDDTVDLTPFWKQLRAFGPFAMENYLVSSRQSDEAREKTRKYWEKYRVNKEKILDNPSIRPSFVIIRKSVSPTTASLEYRFEFIHQSVAEFIAHYYASYCKKNLKSGRNGLLYFLERVCPYFWGNEAYQAMKRFKDEPNAERRNSYEFNETDQDSVVRFTSIYERQILATSLSSYAKWKFYSIGSGFQEVTLINCMIDRCFPELLNLVRILNLKNCCIGPCTQVKAPWCHRLRKLTLSDCSVVGTQTFVDMLARIYTPLWKSHIHKLLRTGGKRKYFSALLWSWKELEFENTSFKD